MPPRCSTNPRGGNRGVPLSIAILATFVALTWTMRAQEALRSAVNEDRRYQLRQQRLVESPSTIQAGPVDLTVSAGLGLTYDDNVLLRETDTMDDLILRPSLNAGVDYPITDRLRLNFGVGISYDIYTQNTRDDRFALAPNSSLAFDFLWGRALFTAYDSFSFSEDLLDQAESPSSQNFGTFNNSLGARVNWVPEPVFVEAGYSWNVVVASNSEFNDLDRNSHQIFGRTGYVVAERTRWGGEVTASQTLYDSSVRNDFKSVSVGPFIEWQLTDAIRLNLRGGWTWTIFDDNGTLTSPDDVSVPYASVDVQHQLTDYFSHGISASREVRVGINTQYIDTYSIRYDLSWNLTDRFVLGAGVSYETGEEPGELATEKYDRLGFNLGFPFQITDRLSLSVGYGFSKRNSDAAGRDYQDNRASLDISYQF